MKEELWNVSGRSSDCQGTDATGSGTTASATSDGGARSVESVGPVAPECSPGSGRARYETAVSGRRRRGLALLAAVLLGLAVPVAQPAEPGKRVAVLDIELLKADYLPDAHRITPEERQRLDMVADLIRNRLRMEGYDAVPAAQTKAAIQAADPGQYLHACNGCERHIARALEADWVAVGWIQFRQLPDPQPERHGDRRGERCSRGPRLRGPARQHRPVLAARDDLPAGPHPGGAAGPASLTPHRAPDRLWGSCGKDASRHGPRSIEIMLRGSPSCGRHRGTRQAPEAEPPEPDSTAFGCR